MTEQEAVAYIEEWDVTEATKVLKWYEERKLLRPCDCETIVAIETEELREERDKLVSVLHEVEEEAVYAYHCLQHDIEVMVADGAHYFDKWWHAECESERLKRENAKLRELLLDAKRLIDRTCDPRCCEHYPECLTHDEMDIERCWYSRRMEELG